MCASKKERNGERARGREQPRTADNVLEDRARRVTTTTVDTQGCLIFGNGVWTMHAESGAACGHCSEGA